MFLARMRRAETNLVEISSEDFPIKRSHKKAVGWGSCFFSMLYSLHMRAEKPGCLWRLDGQIPRLVVPWCVGIIAGKNPFPRATATVKPVEITLVTEGVSRWSCLFTFAGIKEHLSISFHSISADRV